MPSVLFISNLDCCETGFQALPRTVAGFVRQGWSVTYFVVRDSDNSNACEAQDLPKLIPGVVRISSNLPNCHAHRHPVPSSLLHNTIWTVRIWNRLRASCLPEHDVIYAVETVGSLGAIGLSRRWQAATIVHRFFGVAEPQKTLAMTRWRRWVSPHILHQAALALPCHLLVMTDDGTMGDRIVHRHAPANSDRLLFLSNGVDCDRSSAVVDVREGDPGTIHVLMLSRLVEWKRVDLGLAGIAQACARGVDVRVRVVGDGPKRQALEAWVHGNGLSDRVEFIGRVPQASVWRQYSWADVLVSAYDWSNVGNPLFEALSAGVPVVTVANGDTAKWIEDGINGFLCSTNETQIPRDICNALIRLAGKPGLLDQLSTGALRTAERRLRSWDARIDQEIAAITALVQQRRQQLMVERLPQIPPPP